MSFIEEIRQGYMNLDGTVGNQTPAEPTDNSYLFTATYHDICELLKLFDFKTNVIFDHYFYNRMLKPGLFDVDPSWSERTLSHDEINGQTSFSSAFAQCIWLYGITHFWIFRNRPWNEVFSYIEHDITENNRTAFLDFWRAFYRIKRILNEYGSQWIYRMGYLVPFIYVRAGYSVPPWHQLFYFIKMWLVTFDETGETSTRCLYRLHQNHYKNMPWLMRKGYDIYWNDLIKRYDSVGGLYAIYFGKNHPFSTYTQNVKTI